MRPLIPVRRAVAAAATAAAGVAAGKGGVARREPSLAPPAFAPPAFAAQAFAADPAPRDRGRGDPGRRDAAQMDMARAEMGRAEIGRADAVRADAVRAELRRDPAPTIWAYRMQRVMLTPHLRALLRVGLPSLAVLAVVGLYLADDARRAGALGVFTDLREKFENRPEFTVSLASVEGCSRELAEAVRNRLALNLPQSSFDLDLEAARLRIEELDAVKSAELRVRSGGVLQVIVTERDPVAVWRTEAGLTLVDETGHRVASLLARSDRPDLPLIAGQGADAAAPEALDILAAAGPLVPRLRGLVRVGERRWDLVLDRNQRILLPEANPVRALERLLALDHAADILNRDLLAVDLRVGQRPTLRLTPDALNELRRAQGLPVLETNL